MTHSSTTDSMMKLSIKTLRIIPGSIKMLGITKATSESASFGAWFWHYDT
jgi:hypothetical protein